MNFYKHHIGDYDQATRHLTFVEDAAYSRLIRKYYAEEKPLPTELKLVQRLIGARTREEKEAVENVLTEFFLLANDGWHSKRCDEEIAQANKQADTNRRIAQEREEKRRARFVDSQSTIRAVPDNTIRIDVEHDSLQQKKHDSLPSREPSQTPDSRHQTPDVNLNPSVVALSQHPDTAAPPAPDNATRTRQGEIAVLLRTLGAQGVTPAKIALYPWALDPRATDDAIRAAWTIAREKLPGNARIDANYVSAIMPDVLNPKPVKPPRDDWDRSDPGIDRKGRELGMVARGGESYSAFADRIRQELKRRQEQPA